MKAILLAGGYGTRLGELTKDRPKPTIEIGGKTVIERIIENLHLAGITQIIVNLHYLPTVMTEKITNKALFYYEEKLLGQEGTISALQDWLQDDDFFTLNADTITNVDYKNMILHHQPKTISVAMQNWRAAGVWLYSKEYFTNPSLPIVPYRPDGLVFHDIGTPERLEAAKAYYE